MSEIKYGNVLELLSYGFWYQTEDEVTSKGERAFLESTLAELQVEGNIKLQVSHSSVGIAFHWVCWLVWRAFGAL